MTLEEYFDPILQAKRAKDTSEGAPAGGWSLADLADEVTDEIDGKYEKPGTGIPSTDLAQAVLDSISGKYTKPGTGIPATDLHADVQSALTALDLRKATIQLRGTVQTLVNFMAASAATNTSSNPEPFDLTGIGNGGTLIFNTDAAGNQTATVNFTAGKSVSGASPAIDITTLLDTKFMISVDGEDAEEVELTVAGKDDGTKIATEMQTKIQALGGVFTAVTVDYNVTTPNKYTILSGTLGSGSSVVVTAAAHNNITEELKIGTVDGGTETAGTGDVVNAAIATAAEIAAVIAGDCNKLNAEDLDGSVVITSKTTGRTSSILVGNGTLGATIGFTNADLYIGGIGLAQDSIMLNANYVVMPVIKNTAGGSLAGKQISITNKTVEGFIVECETAAATDYVDLLILA